MKVARCTQHALVVFGRVLAVHVRTALVHSRAHSRYAEAFMSTNHKQSWRKSATTKIYMCVRARRFARDNDTLPRGNMAEDDKCPGRPCHTGAQEFPSVDRCNVGRRISEGLRVSRFVTVVFENEYFGSWSCHFATYCGEVLFSLGGTYLFICLLALLGLLREWKKELYETKKEIEWNNMQEK